MASRNGFFMVVFVLLAAINIVDFLFYGYGVRNLIGAVGFAAMAYGGYANARIVSIIGAALALGSIAVKYVV